MPALSMALGAGETTLLRMVTAYAMIDNGGKKIESTFIDRIQDRYGRTVWRHDDRDCTKCVAREWTGQQEPELVDKREQIVDPISAFQMVGIQEGVVLYGTGRKLASLGRPLAGKTGTTNDYKDAWFIGYTPDLVVGAYVGYDQPKTMGRSSTGGGLAAPIVKDFFEAALKDVPPVPFRAPPGAVLVRVNHKTGLPARPGDSNVIVETFKSGQLPTGATGEVVEDDTSGAAQGEDFPDYPDAAQAGPPPGFPPAPGQYQPPPRSGFPGGPPSNDRALTSGTGGLY